MFQSFNEISDKVDSLQLRIDICKVYADNPDNEVLKEMFTVLQRITNNLTATRDILKKQKVQNEEILDLNRKSERLTLVIENLNDYFEKQPNEDTETEEHTNNTDVTKKSNIPENKENVRIETPCSIKLDGVLESALKCEIARPSKTNLSPSVLMYDLENITESEFDSIPKYMLGRITMNQINAFINIINAAITKKYSLLNKHRSAISSSDMREYLQYRADSVPELKGKLYISEFNIVEILRQKCLDKKSLTYIAILRQVKKLFMHNARSGKYYYL